MADRLRKTRRRAANDETTIAVANQHDVDQLFRLDVADHIGDVGIEVDPGRHQMRAFAEPGQRRRGDAMPLGLQQWHQQPPAPAAVPRAVDQNERTLRLRLDRHGFSPPRKRRDRRRQLQKPPAFHRSPYDVAGGR